mmetsp:Transcript_4948/g.9445  ORF Transcript_4948/g.9445 Transcript_4948/m.9445 type:complete len:125 (-) Transcript_4948:42-416(-)
MSMADPRADANAYLKEKKVLELFHDLGTKLVYSKPEDPNAFLLKVLSEIQEGDAAGAPTTFFTSKDVSTMFSMFDPTGKGTITMVQYKNALKSFGIEEMTVPVEGDVVNRETFEKVIVEELAKL